MAKKPQPPPTMAQFLARSTEASGVPLKVKSKRVLLAVAQMLKG